MLSSSPHNFRSKSARFMSISYSNASKFTEGCLMSCRTSKRMFSMEGWRAGEGWGCFAAHLGLIQYFNASSYSILLMTKTACVFTNCEISVARRFSASWIISISLGNLALNSGAMVINSTSCVSSDTRPPSSLVPSKQSVSYLWSRIFLDYSVETLPSSQALSC